jgi:hypothetical protein
VSRRRPQLGAVTFMGQQTNLHAVWDSAIIGPAVKGDERGYALRLARDITLAEHQQWSAGSAASWADERLQDCTAHDLWAVAAQRDSARHL